MFSYIKYLFKTTFSMLLPCVSLEEDIKRKQKTVQNICIRLGRGASLAQGKFLTTQTLEARRAEIKKWFSKK